MVNIIEEQPSFASQIGKGLGQNIASFGAGALEGYVGKKKKAAEQKELESFADKIEKNYPNSPMHKTIADLYRSNLPMDQKSEIVKGLTGLDPFKALQQERLNKEASRKQYNQRIKEEMDKLKSYPPLEEEKRIKAFVKKLQTERDYLLGFDEGDERPAPEEKEEEKPKKVKFKESNPEHKAKAQQLMKKFNDKEKVRQELAKEFEF
jgi:hypothetical protein